MTEAPDGVDVRIAGELVVAMDAGHSEIAGGHVEVGADRIVHVGPEPTAAPATETIDAREQDLLEEVRGRATDVVARAGIDLADRVDPSLVS